MPSPLCEVKDGSGSYQNTDGGVDVTPDNTITIHLIDTSADSWSISCIYTDDSSSASTVNAALVIDSSAKTATFPAGGEGKAYIFKSTVNNGLDANLRPNSSYSTTFGIYTLTESGLRVVAVNETTEGNSTFGWVTSVNDVIRNQAIATTDASALTTGTLSAARLPAFVGGDVTSTAGSAVLTIGTGAVTSTKLGTGSVDLSTTKVTGTLATARLPGFTGGDVTSSAGSLVLSLGSGVVTSSKLASSAVDLTTSTVTGTLPVSKGGTGLSALGTALYVLRVNGTGTALEFAAASTAAASGTANTVQTSDGSGNFSGATNVKAGSGYISIGSTVASAGAIRMAATDKLSVRNSGNTADLDVFSVDTSGNLNVWGSSGSFYGSIRFTLASGASFDIGTRMFVNNTNIQCALPVSGYSTSNLPFRFKSASISCTAGGTITATAAQYECPMLTLTGTPGAAFDLVLPNTADAAFNIKNSTGQTVTIKISGGTGFALATGSSRWAFHNGTDYEAR